MPCDRSARTSYSPLPHPRVTHPPLCPPLSRVHPRTASSNDICSPPHIPYRPQHAPPQVQMNDLAPTSYDALQHTRPAHVFHPQQISLQFPDNCSISQRSSPLQFSPTQFKSATSRPQPTGLNPEIRRPQYTSALPANEVNPEPRHFPSAPPYHEEGHDSQQPFWYNSLTLPPVASTLPHSVPAPSVTQYYHSANSQSHLTYHAYHPDTLRQGSGSSSPLPLFTHQRTHGNNQGTFHGAHDFVIHDPVFVNNNSDNFMALLFKETIPGAEFDSRARNPPPRCHPGTRLKVIDQCQRFVLTNSERKLRWVVGAAGVGKSAIMQSVAEDKSGVLSNIIVGATIFFSIDGRQDGTKTMTTIAYQMAVKLEPYRLFIKGEVTRDPSLLRKSLSTQFEKFIVQPFIVRGLLCASSRLLIIVDGLDECDGPTTQRELLDLIANFCTTYPTSPLVWMIASRPEPHITSFFSQPKFALIYEKEEILVDSNQARSDVEGFLRDKLQEVQLESIPLKNLPRWPSEDDFLKIAKASDGLFAYADTAARYISDPAYGDPVSQLSDVLGVIETGAKEIIPGKDHPMAHLDALYRRIISKIPPDAMVNTRKLLLLCCDEYWGDYSFQFHCNMLGMTTSAAYGATHHIYSIAIVPGPREAATGRLKFFHKSVEDYLKDFQRSGFSRDINSELQQLRGQCALRVVEGAPDGINWGGLDNTGFFDGGVLKNGGTGENIPLSWPVDELGGGYDSRRLRSDMYSESVWEVMSGFRRREEAFQSLLCLRLLTTCFVQVPCDFPNMTLRDVAFDVSRRQELLEYGMLKLMPLEMFKYDEIAIPSSIRLCFRGSTTELSDTWNMSCKHKREGKWEGREYNWFTEFRTPIERFYRTDFHRPTWELQQCNYCFQRFTRHFETRSPSQLVTVLGITPGWRWVELRFVDEDDGMSEWTYCFGHGEGEMNIYSSL